MDLLNSIFPAAVAYTMPLLMGALGGLYSERSGVTNLCIEGLMLMGCFTCATVMTKLQGVLPMNVCFALGLVSGLLASSVFSLLHAVAAINLKADQTISGTAINMISTALTVYLAQTVTGSGNITIAHAVVPFAVPQLFSDSFHALLWSFLFTAILYFVVRFLLKVAKKPVSGLWSRLPFAVWLGLSGIVALVFSLFVPSPLACALVGAVVAWAMWYVLRSKPSMAKEGSAIARICADPKNTRSLAAATTGVVVSGLFAQLGVGSFLRGMAFTRVYWTTIVCVLIWAASYFLLYKTSFGLRLRACGEHPSAVASAGVNVHRMRYIGVIASGALAGLGGATYLITVGGEFNSASGMNGLGFLAIAGLIFGQWKPLGILGSTFFFGFCYTIANMSRVVPALAVVPPGILSAFPYVATLIVLVLTSKRNAAPLASGVPY